MKILILLVCIFIFITPVSALEIEAPEVPESGQKWMPDHIENFSDGFTQIIQKVLIELNPAIKDAVQTCISIIVTVLMISFLHIFSTGTKHVIETAGAVTVASLMLLSTNSMIHLASDTVRQITDYGKLLIPVLTAAMAAQGGVSSSAALYSGSAIFIMLLETVITNMVVPGIYIYLSLCIGNGATGEQSLKRLADLLKACLNWCLKILLIVFTTYLSITGVVSGTTDAAALKAAKVTMSTFVPVVGSVLSDASEAVLISAGFMKNAAGIYGMLAILALFLYPFLQIGIQYLILKVTSALCTVADSSRISSVIESFGNAMAVLLAMTGVACVMVLISAVCYLKGMG